MPLNRRGGELTLWRRKPAAAASVHLFRWQAPLQVVARPLRNEVHPTDLVVRWGGEEFLVVLPGANLDYTLATTALLHSAIGKAEVGLRLIVSAGIAARAWADTPRVALLHADYGIYAAKDRALYQVVAGRLLSSADVVVVSRLCRAETSL